MRCLDEISCCVGCRMFFLMVCVVRTVESWMLKDAGDGVYTMVHIDVAWFCVRKLGGSLAGMNVSWVMSSALGDRQVCVTSMHDIKSRRVFERMP